VSGNRLWRFAGVRPAALLLFAYLYIPIVILIVLSFNENRTATIWTGFSARWYGEVLRTTTSWAPPRTP
jgi:spermidine/putrescine transport system permease protein